jgi:NAD(P)H-hydrate epimerase
MQKSLKIFSAEQIKKADAFTIIDEPISSIDLMERAAVKCSEWIKQHIEKKDQVIIFCGSGNNGGDGLAIARQLFLSDFKVKVYKIEGSINCSGDFIKNEERIKQIPGNIYYSISSIIDFPEINKNDIIIDAIFGSGLNKKVSGLAADCILSINESGAKIISIDLPSGLFSDKHSDPDSPIVNADITLSFQFPKLAFLFAENEKYSGNWQILDIGLSEKFIEQEPSNKFLLTKEFVGTILKKRKNHSNKGTFGNALIVAGSFGKMGAAVLSSNACLRSGVGLLTMHIPKCGYEIIQITSPEAMASIDNNMNIFSDKINPEKYSSVAIGPGIGVEQLTQDALKHLISNANKPLILDADALNILSMNKDWFDILPPGSILTPHPKEFERLTEKIENDFKKHEKQIEFSKKYNVFIILKGANTCISTPDGDCYFNSTGNPGMAKGGSGDILTGIIAGIMAQGYSSIESCILGVYVHGLAGDFAEKELGETGMISSDITDRLPKAFQAIRI